MLPQSKKILDKIPIGWIGTGVMGYHMCSHIMAAGYPMTVYNRTLSKCEPLKTKGASIANSPKEVALNSKIIFTMVGYPSDVEEIIIGQNGLIHSCNENSIIIDMTTSTPSLAVKLYEECSKNNIHILDAPVSGGDIGARNKTLSIMVGGDIDIYNQVYPLFELLGNNISYMGNCGQGQNTKMVNQILIANNMIGLCEGLLYGYKSGLNLEETIKVIGSGAAGSFSLNKLGPRIIQGDFDPGFYVEHFIKDMGIALEESKRMNISLPGLSFANQFYIALKTLGYGKKGTQSLIAALEHLNNIHYFSDLEKKRTLSKQHDHNKSKL